MRRRRRRSVGRTRGDERVIHLCVRFFYAIHVVTLYSRDSVASSSARLGAQYGVNLFPSSVAARRRNSRQNVTAVAFEMTAHSAMISSRLSSRSFASRATTARGTAPSSESSDPERFLTVSSSSSPGRRGRHRAHPQFIACVDDGETCARGHASPLAHRPRRKKAHRVDDASPSRERGRFDADAGEEDARRAAMASSSSSRGTGTPTSSRSTATLTVDGRRSTSTSTLTKRAVQTWICANLLLLDASEGGLGTWEG